jgi:hypothetical protein
LTADANIKTNTSTRTISSQGSFFILMKRCAGFYPRTSRGMN